MLLFLISMCRAIVEMLGLCLLAQGVLYVMAGNKRFSNPIYQFFAIITRAPLRLTKQVLPQRLNSFLIGTVCFLVLFLVWFGLAIARKFL